MTEYAVKLKEIQDKYQALAALAQKGSFAIDPLDPLAVKCSVGDSCCAGTDQPGIESRILTEQEKHVAQEVQSLRVQYADVVKKMTAEGAISPEVMDLADACSCGDACHTGTTDRIKSGLDEVTVQMDRLKAARQAGVQPGVTTALRAQYAELAKKVADMGDAVLGGIDLVGYTCHGGEHCHGGSSRQLDRLATVSAAAGLMR